jgi:uncharacterized OsmC-like protein
VTDKFALNLALDENYRMVADFDTEGVPALLMDEYPPLGEGTGPNPARVLGAAVGGCLSASLLFCLRKARLDVRDLKVRVEGGMARNEKGRLRIESLSVRLSPVLEASQIERLGRCLELFEDFCIVTESVRHGIRVDVALTPVPAATEAAAPA